MVFVDVKEIPIVFWGGHEEYHESPEYLSGFVDGAELEPVMRVGDECYSEWVYKLPNGRHVITDNACGSPYYFDDDAMKVLYSLGEDEE